MIPESHQMQLNILFGFIVFLMFAIFLAIGLSQSRRKKEQATSASLKENQSSIGSLDESPSVDLDDKTLILEQSPAENTDVEELMAPSAISLKEALKNTESSFFGRIRDLFKSENLEVLEGIEEVLYTSDLGPQTVQKLMSQLNEEISKSDKKDLQLVKSVLRTKMLEIFEGSQATQKNKNVFFERLHQAATGPTVIMVVGVNGAGKTTSIGKISALLTQNKKRVLVAAGDTFRAAAGGQLKVWTDRAQVEIFSPEGVTDPSAVAFDAISKAKAQNYDYVIVDTAGRLHTQTNLMEELKKMKRVMLKVIPEAPHETLIILDSNSGQNALMQAKEFHAALGLTGVILTKMDGTAKGGVAVGVANDLQIPIKFIGVGEKIGDLRLFHHEEFVDSILGG